MEMVKRITRVARKNRLICFLYNVIRDTKNIKKFSGKRLELTNTSIIKIAFLCQSIFVWNKFESVYHQLKSDSRFLVYMICIPSAIQDNRMLNKDCEQNDTYNYFASHGYSVVNALIGKNKWFDLRELGCDYVVYTRPYNNYMPDVYASAVVSQYSRIISLLYAMNLTEDTYNTTLNRNFYNDVYIFFAETETSKKHFNAMYPLTTILKLRQCFFCGMPALEQVLLDRDKLCTTWDFSKNRFRILWTPRWTTDKSLGGSNFFLYYHSLLYYAESNTDIDLLCRPHPMMFDNFIKTGEMTQSEVTEYKEQIASMPNVCLDNQAEYDATMWNSNVLVSDISGIMPEYFMTGKPIIYCASNMGLTLAKHTKEMLKGCYIANHPDELFKYLNMLNTGNDPLQKTRKELINYLFGSRIRNSAKHIADTLIDSYSCMKGKSHEKNRNN